MRLVFLLTCVSGIATPFASVAAEPPPAGAKAASRPASGAAPIASEPATAPVRVQVRFGSERPGTPAVARLQVPALPLDISTDERGERDLPALPKGKFHLKVFVAGADQCDLDFDAPGSKPMTVKLFVPKRGLGTKCERTAD